MNIKQKIEDKLTYETLDIILRKNKGDKKLTPAEALKFQNFLIDSNLMSHLKSDKKYTTDDFDCLLKLSLKDVAFFLLDFSSERSQGFKVKKFFDNTIENFDTEFFQICEDLAYKKSGCNINTSPELLSIVAQTYRNAKEDVNNPHLKQLPQFFRIYIAPPATDKKWKEKEPFIEFLMQYPKDDFALDRLKETYVTFNAVGDHLRWRERKPEFTNILKDEVKGITNNLQFCTVETEHKIKVVYKFEAIAHERKINQEVMKGLVLLFSDYLTKSLDAKLNENGKKHLLDFSWTYLLKLSTNGLREGKELHAELIKDTADNYNKAYNLKDIADKLWNDAIYTVENNPSFSKILLTYKHAKEDNGKLEYIKQAEEILKSFPLFVESFANKDRNKKAVDNAVARIPSSKENDGIAFKM